MSSCSIRNRPSTPYLAPEYWITLTLIILDLALTITGIRMGAGTEGNPMYAWFTARGTPYMIVGAAIYIIIVTWLFFVVPNWLSAIMTGFLSGVHTIALMSWVHAMWLPQIEFIYTNNFYLMVIPTFVGVIVTMIAYVDIRTCPGVAEPPEFEWTNKNP